MSNVSVVYTPFTNLKKTASMEVGQVGFHNQKKVSKSGGTAEYWVHRVKPVLLGGHGASTGCTG